ncbi:MAG: DUF4252 domain-containing protein [Bacteroidetes bacterium]|nr:DUF4252 domain-containing protein [Bacteroidota bacterium]
MKRFILLLVVVVLTLPTQAQQTKTFFKTLTDKFAEQDGFSASMITSDMFDLYLKKRNIDEESPVFEALKKLDKVMVVSQSSLKRAFVERDVSSNDFQTKNEVSSNEIHKTFLNHYNTDEYTLFKTEKRLGEDVKVYLKKSNEKIESLALITNSSVSTNLIELQGDIDLKTISELNQALNLRGLENLYKIENSSNNWYNSRIYSGEGSSERLEELSSVQRDQVAKQRELSDKQRVQFEKQAQLTIQKQLEMAEKYREMAEKYQRAPIFLSYPGDTNTVYFLDGKKVKAKKIKEIDQDKIESVEVHKSDEEKDKTTIRIKTK